MKNKDIQRLVTIGALGVAIFSTTTSYKHIALAKNMEQTISEVELEKNTILTEKDRLSKIVDELKTLSKEETKRRVELEKEIEKLKKSLSQNNVADIEKGKQLGVFKATAYDLTYNSCGKHPHQKGYGLTATGESLVGKSIISGKSKEIARVIAVDPKIIPLRREVYIEFPDEYKHFNGVFKTLDTGGAIKGKKVDIYIGEQNVSKEVAKFGRRQVKVTLLEE